MAFSAAFSREAGRTQYSAFSSPTLLKVEIYQEGPRNGSFGSVYHGICDGKDVAVKQMRYSSSGDDAEDDRAIDKHTEEMLWKEAQIMVRLKHDNVLAFLGLCKLPPEMRINEICLVSPWVEQSNTLLKFLSKNLNANRHQLMSDVAAALAYLHGQLDADGTHIVHGDLHEKNVLIDIVEGRRPRERALLCDFGLSKVVPAGQDGSNSFNGGARAGVILAPELEPVDPNVRAAVRSKETDVFAYGALAYTAYKGHAPYKETKMTRAAIAKELDAGNRPPRPTRPDLTDGMWQLITQCWAQSPKRRPTMEVVVSRLQQCAPA